MIYQAKVLADSIASGVRLVTMEACFPRFILAEFNTHRAFSRNSASSRAIPVEKRIAQVRDNPFVPEAFGVNKRGMQATDTLDERDGSKARDAWLRARDAAVEQAEALVNLGVHKQHANRLLEPYAWHTVVVSATEWDNFFNLRTHKAAQPEMQIIAKMMREAYEASVPRGISPGDWHLPYITDEEREAHCDADPAALPVKELVATSVVRCAAVSFERQHAERSIEDILLRHDNLAASAHWSPFEHQAKVAERSKGELPRPGNFRPPWTQYRKTFEGESVWTGGST